MKNTQITENIVNNFRNWLFEQNTKSKLPVSDILQNIKRYENSIWVFFDTETTGLNPENTQLLEIAGIAVRPSFTDGDAKVLAKYHDTTSGAEYIEESEAISGFIKFIDRLSSEGEVILVAHNATFDRKFISVRSKKYSLPIIKNKTIDTLQVMEEIFYPLLIVADEADILPKIKMKFGVSFSLGIISKALNISVDNWHSALADVQMLIKTTQAVVNMLEKNPDLDVRSGYEKAIKAKRRKQQWIKKLKESNEGERNLYVLIGPPAVGKSSWIRKHIKEDKIIISKDDIIEKVIFPKYGLSNRDLFSTGAEEYEVDAEHPEKKKLGKVKKIKRYSRSQQKDVEKKVFDVAYEAAEEMNRIHDSRIQSALASGVKNIIVDAMHMQRSTRKSTIDLVRGNKDFKIIGVVFPFQGYEKQIKQSADTRSKAYIEKLGSDFDREVSWEDYRRIYSSYEPPSMSEGFDKLEEYNRFDKKDIDLEETGETLDERLVRHTRETLEEGRLSKYWKNRADSRSKNAGREPKNDIDREWAKGQQEQSTKINARIHKYFQKEIESTDELSEEVEAFLERVKQERSERKKKMMEKVKFRSPKDPKSKKTLPSPYKDAKVTDKYPFSKDRTGGVAKVYKKRSKQSGGPTIAPGEAFGPMEGLEKGKYTKLSVFDFDGTLFRSPERPKDFKGNWWSNKVSLKKPYVDDVADDSLWINQVVKAAKQELSKEDTLTIFMTGRIEQMFKNRIIELLSQKGLKFDHYKFGEFGVEAAETKIAEMQKILKKYPSIKKIEMWEDYEDNIILYNQKFRKDYRIKINKVS